MMFGLLEVDSRSEADLQAASGAASAALRKNSRRLTCSNILIRLHPRVDHNPDTPRANATRLALATVGSPKQYRRLAVRT